MAIRFFAVAVASVGLVTSAFGADPVPMAPATMPATVMTQSMPMQTVKTGMFGRRTKMVPMTTTSGSVMPAGYTAPMTGTVMAARADTPGAQPMPTAPKAMPATAGTTPMPTTTAPVVTSTESAPSMAATPTTPARKRLFSRLSYRRS